jgi:hypothetical protein
MRDNGSDDFLVHLCWSCTPVLARLELVFASLIESLETAATADLAGASDDELFEAAVELERARSLIEITEAHVLAALERRDATDTEFGLSTSGWLADRARIPRGAATDRTKKATQICRHLPAIDEAVVDGRLTFEHARALVNAASPRVRDALADLQQPIIELAADSSFAQWQVQVRRLLELLDQDGPRPDDDPSRDRLSFRSTLDGVTHVDGTMTSSTALAVTSAVEARANELARRARRDHATCPELPVPTRATLRMQALAELVTGARADGQPRAEVTLVARDGETTDERGNAVPRTAAAVWRCDAELWAVLLDRMGSPVDLGHARRLATRAQRRAIALRDGGCAFPGCDQPMAWCDVHHVVPVERGGRTDLDNLVALCRHHHTVSHRPGWALEVTRPGTYRWITPTGRTFTNRAPPTSWATAA